MKFTEHLAELRRRLMAVLAVLLLCMVGGMFAAEPLIHYLKQAEPARNMEWNVFSPWDSLRIYFQVAFAVAVVVTVPFALYQLWAFVKPALQPHEKRAALFYVPLSCLLAIAGIAFGYFAIFPLAFHFTSFLADRMELTETYGVSQYFGFMFNILVPLAAFFQLPMILMFLATLRIIHPEHMTKFRKYAYFFLFVIGAVITPPDLVSAMAATIPMIGLYELGIVLARKVHRKQREAEARLVKKKDGLPT